MIKFGSYNFDRNITEVNIFQIYSMKWYMISNGSITDSIHLDHLS